MTILDVSIVNVALPRSARRSTSRRPAVGPDRLRDHVRRLPAPRGPRADLLGRRRVFMVGVALFSIASLVCGLSTSGQDADRGPRRPGSRRRDHLARGALDRLTTFEEGADRNKALGIWGALGGSGAAVGVLAGGVLTKYLGWEWIFFVNVPVGASCSPSRLGSFARAGSKAPTRVRPVRRGPVTAAWRCSSTRSRGRPTSAGERPGRSASDRLGSAPRRVRRDRAARPPSR